MTHRAADDPDYLPTRDEIAAEAARIRAENAVAMQRVVGSARPLSVREPRTVRATIAIPEVRRRTRCES